MAAMSKMPVETRAVVRHPVEWSLVGATIAARGSPEGTRFDSSVVADGSVAVSLAPSSAAVAAFIDDSSSMAAHRSWGGVWEGRGISTASGA